MGIVKEIILPLEGYLEVYKIISNNSSFSKLICFARTCFINPFKLSYCHVTLFVLEKVLKYEYKLNSCQNLSPECLMFYELVLKKKMWFSFNTFLTVRLCNHNNGHLLIHYNMIISIDM